MNKQIPWFRAYVLPVCASLLVLAAVSVDRRVLRTEPADASAYHQQLREAAEKIPLHIGSWMGVDTEVPQAAIRILHPNVIISRTYQNMSTGESVRLLLVQVQDARDVLGHYPPICYAGQGWVQKSSEPIDASSGDMQIAGTRYTFTSNRGGRAFDMTVDNFLALPTGKTCRDMDGVDRVARDSHMKFFGAAQVQIVYDESIEAARRQELFETFVGVTRPLLEKMPRGVGQ